MRVISNMDEMRRSLLLLGGRRAWNGEEFALQGGCELFATEDGSCEIIRGFGAH